MSTSITRAFPTKCRQMGTLMSVITVLVLFPMSPSAHAQPLFQPAFPIDVGIRPRVIAIGDLNGDGRTDLVVGNAGPVVCATEFFCGDSSYVSVILGNADGTLAPISGGLPQQYSHPTQLVLADLNGDDQPDLVQSRWYSAGSYVFPYVSTALGDGDGTFSPTGYSLITRDEPIAAADLNGDTHADLVIAHGSGAEINKVSVHLGNGDGSFGDGTLFGTGAAPIAVAIADFDHDDIPDVATACQTDGRISILRGHGDGTFAPKIDYVTGAAPRGLAVGDLNRDGLPDLAVLFDTYVGIHYNLGGGVLGPLHAYDAGGNVTGAAFGNFDFDFWPDLAVVTSSGSTAIWLGAGPDTLGPRQDFPLGGASLAVGDVNGDFEPDIVTVGSGICSMLLNVTDQTVAAPRALAGGDGLDLVAPNPARDVSRIEYIVARAGAVRLEVVDVTGRVVATLFQGVQPAGRHHASWNGSAGNERLPAGLYFIRLMTPERAFARKLIRIR